MQKIVSVTLRTVAIVVHLLQALTSFTAGLYLSGVVGATLIGVQIYNPTTFRELFRVSSWVVSVIGSIIWLLVAVGELW
jgi:hypothetical protein